jgi:DNA-binding transcriptional MerR regulator
MPVDAGLKHNAHFLKIGEFSQLGQVTIRALRHYDDLGLLKPAFIDPDSDYRYYAIEQLPRLNRIVALKDLGLSLDQIAPLLAHDVAAEELRGMLEARQAELAQRIAAEQVTLARVAARLRQIEREGRVSPYEVARKATPDWTVATIRQIVPDLTAMTACRCAMYDELYAQLRRRGISPAGLEFGLYHNPEYVEQAIDMELGVVVPAAARGQGNDRLRIAALPGAAEVASVTHHGDIWDIPQAMIALYQWLAANERTATGPYREMHLYGRENDQRDFTNLVLEVQVSFA